MKNSQLLLLSSSRANNTGYLVHALPMIKEHLKDITEILFIPYAGVTISFNQYTEQVSNALAKEKISVVGIHQKDNAIEAINNAKAIVVGGGNTFQLLHLLYKNDLVDAIKQKVNEGIPYIGWSAGSNIAGISIRTTNDMPIVEPKSFNALNLINIQLNPHYTNYSPEGHNGETRDQRLAEFMIVDKETPIIGIVEGSALKTTMVDGTQRLKLIGGDKGYLFHKGEKITIEQASNLDEFL